MNKLFQLKIESEKWKVMILNGHSERSEELQGLKVDSSGKTLRIDDVFERSF